MKTIRFGDALQEFSEEFALARNASEILPEILGPSASLVEAEWGLENDLKGRALITLRLKDFTGEVVGKFAPDELRSPSQTSFRLYRLWGDLLQVQNEMQLKALQESRV